MTEYRGLFNKQLNRQGKGPTNFGEATMTTADQTAFDRRVEAAAKALCFCNQQAECAQCTPETCLYGLRDYREEATAALLAADAASPASGVMRAALTEIDGWRDDTLGARPKEPSKFDCAPEITEAFDRGCRMAFYRCADRARAALSASPAPAVTEEIARIATELAPQLDKLIDAHLEQIGYSGSNVLKQFLWDNKVGILRVLEATMIRGHGTGESNG